MNIGVVGYGRWGPNVARSFASVAGCALVAACDLSEERLALAGRHHASAALTSDWTRLVQDRRIDAVAIATPADRHFEMALTALRAGKHVFVEKPLARTGDEVRALIEESRRRGVVLMVDHTYVFSSPLRLIAHLLASGRLGVSRYLDSVRLNRGVPRRDASVVWDLAVHDLAILDRLLRVGPHAVTATGQGGGLDALEHSARLTLFYPGDFVARVQVSWVAAAKVRRVTLGGSQQVVVWDDLEPQDKVRVHASGADEGTGSAPAPAEIPPPASRHGEPLDLAAEHFLWCIGTRTRPVTDGESALRVVRLLEAATRSMTAKGGAVAIEPAIAEAS